MENKMNTETISKQIWDTLSPIDCSKHVEKKGSGNFVATYLSWTWAWGILMENFPKSFYEFAPNETHADGTVTVHCIVNVNGIIRKMWLPVMNHMFKATVNPDARQISDAKMRCLVKCIAMFGLGHYIYAGEDIPSADKEKSSEKQVKKELNENQVPPKHQTNEVNDAIKGDLEKLKANLNKVKDIKDGVEKLGQSI
jgi:hypothetical protein